MKSLLLLTFLFLVIGIRSFASEIRTSAEILEISELKRARYILKTDMLDALVLNMTYGESYLISEADKRLLKDAEVLAIDLVFTDFPKGQDLKKLNLERIKMVESWRKSLVTDPSIPWKIIRQTDCKNEGEAKTMFHGIVIHYKGPQTEEDRIAEIHAVSGFLPEESELKDAKTIRRSLKDSSIVKILERKKEWDKITIVADLTGSMAPYTSQLVLWFKLKTDDKRVKELVFFNDGDKTPDDKKIIGNTGGIYADQAKNYTQVRALALKTIEGGCGGDGPENNIEALKYAMTHTDSTNQFIMVADNTANVKDIALLYTLKQPVHIILCGAQYGINVHYLNIARATGGSVHTMEEDLENLSSLKEGETVIFKKKKFILSKGLFVAL